MNAGSLRAILPAFIAFCFWTCMPASASTYQAPKVLKLEPPSWWAGLSLNPVRLMVYGRNLAGAQIKVKGKGLKIGTVRVNPSGTYLFFDVEIQTAAVAGKRAFKIATPGGQAEVPFEVLKPLVRRGHFQGFSSDDVIYLIMPDRFADGDPSNDNPPGSKGQLDRTKGRSYHGGDLQGVINHLPYLKDLGVTAIWLTPVYANYGGLFEPIWYSAVPFTHYHGYGPVDFYAVDKHLGDVAKLRELVDKAHGMGIKVILDQVFNHISLKHPWVTDPPTETWCHDTPEKHLQNTFQSWLPADPYASAEALRPVMEGWFDDLLPDLNQDDPETARYLIQNMFWWVGMSGVDGLRLDSLNYVPRTFWKESLAALKREYPDIRAVGEVNSNDPAAVSYFQGGRPGFDSLDIGLDSVFDFPLRDAMRSVFVEGKSASELPAALSRDHLYPNPGMLVAFFGLHDDPRFMGLAGATPEALQLAFTFLLTTRGIPLIYYGDEIAMRGGGDPDNRRDFPGGWPDDPRNAFESEGRTEQEKHIFEHARRLMRLRAESEPLRRGRLVNLVVGEGTYAYARIADPAWVIVVLNSGAKPEGIEFASSPVRISPEVSLLEDRLGSATVAQVKGGRIKVELPARSAAVYAGVLKKD